MASSSVSFRSFTVFVDSEDTEQKPKTKSPMRLARSFSDSSIFTASSPIATNKENMDPLTGERVASSNAVGKKRKGSISVLTAKPVILEKAKSQEAQPETKKRKSSVSSGSSSKPKAIKTSASSSVKKTGKRSSRRASPMPKVEEENEAEREQKKLDQAQIDSKCYDLTVKPLADVSEAYESPVEGQDGFHIVKEASAEPELRDYIASTSSFSSFSSTLRGSSPAEPKNFSTPERKQIYSAFTFTSPSPSSKLLTKMRSTSLPPLEFGDVAKTS